MVLKDFASQPAIPGLFVFRRAGRLVRLLLVVACFAAAATTLSFGQSFTATVSGTVMDPSGAVLPGVQLTVVNNATSLTRTVVSAERGDYVVPLLPVGTYQITAELAGFKTEVRQGITLQVDQRLRVDFQMQIGELTEHLMVTETAPLVDSETSSIGGVVENRRVVQLPLNGREFQSLTLLVPGAMPPTPGSIETSYGAITIAGARETSTGFAMDGTDLVDGLVARPSFKPSIDMIQEFKVQTSSYTAEMGRTAGGHVTVTTKSGSNAFHGTLYEFVRNHIFDAKNYFDPPNEPIPPFKRNNFGGTIGGPIKRDQSFFFFNYEGLRLRQAITRTATVPLPQMIQGDFSSIRTPIVDPFTGQAFSGNRIPPDRINRVGQNVAKLFPAPNIPGDVRNFVSTPIDKRRLDQATIRVDHRFTDKNNIFARYTYNDDFELDPFDLYQGLTNLPGYGRTDDQFAHNVSITDTHVFNPNLVGEFRLAYNRYFQLRAQEDPSDIPGKLGIPGTTKDPSSMGYPLIRITGYDVIGKATVFPSDRTDNTYQAVTNITLTRGSHSIKFGGDVSRFESHNLQNGGQQGSFTFTGQYTGHPLADVLLGSVRQSQISLGDTRNPIYRAIFSGYLQDDWRITPRLTLNLGLRYDYMTPVVSANDRMSRFDPETRSIEIAGEPNLRRDISRPDLNLGGPDYRQDLARLAESVKFVNIGQRNIYSLDKNDFAPRLGFAYRALDNDRLIVRSGYGVFYEMLYLNSGGLGVGRNYPFKVTQVYNAAATAPNVFIDNPFPEGLGAATISPVSIRKDYRTGYIHQYNLGFQYQVLPDVVLEMTYVGSKSTKLNRSVNINQAYPSLVGSVASRRPYPDFGNISYTEPAANAVFNSLQMRMEKRRSDGLTILGSYTWSKSIDDHSGASGTGDNNAAQNNNNWVAGMRGLSNFDARHRLVVSYVYPLPFGRNGTGFANWLIQGWEVSGISTFMTGRPLTVITSTDISNTGNTPNDRPNLVADPNLPRSERTVDRWFDTSAFVLPARGTFGNAGRNIVTGPGVHNHDFALMKNNRISEATNMQFRAEMFNFANHPQFDLPNRDVSSPQFGRIFKTSQFSRQIQFGMKLIF